MDEKILINIPEQARGFAFDGNNLVIDDSAIAGTYTIELYCVPSYNSPAQKIFRKFIQIELFEYGNIPPDICNLEIIGNVSVGETLTAKYTFCYDGAKEDASVCQWKYADTEHGKYYDIPGANSINYTVTEEYVDKFIRLYIIPATSDGIMGQGILSHCISFDNIINVDIISDFDTGNICTVMTSGLPESCEIIFATYNGNDLVYLDSYTYDNSPSVEFNPPGKFEKVKVMVWKGLFNPCPLTDVLIVNGNSELLM